MEGFSFGLRRRSELGGGYSLTVEDAVSIEVSSEIGDALLGSLMDDLEMVDRAEDAPAEEH